MNDIIKIAAIALTPLLVVGGLFYFTDRNRKVQFFVLLPLFLTISVWLGFANGWRAKDLFQLGFLLVWGVVGSVFILRAPVHE